MYVLLITRLLRLVGRLARKPVNHTSWVAVVTPTDRPKSVRNRCVIELFCGVVYVVTLPFWHFCWCMGFCHRTESDLFLFLFIVFVFCKVRLILRYIKKPQVLLWIIIRQTWQELYHFVPLVAYKIYTHKCIWQILRQEKICVTDRPEFFSPTLKFLLPLKTKCHKMKVISCSDLLFYDP